MSFPSTDQRLVAFTPDPSVEPLIEGIATQVLEQWGETEGSEPGTPWRVLASPLLPEILSFLLLDAAEEPSPDLRLAARKLLLATGFDSFHRFISVLHQALWEAIDPTRSQLPKSTADTLRKRVDERLLKFLAESAREAIITTDERRIRLARMLAHEFRNEINALGTSVAMASDDSDAGLVAESLSLARRCMAELTDLFEELSDYAAVGAGRLQPTNVPIALDELGMSLEQALAARMESAAIEFRVSAGPGMAKTDPSLVTKIVRYLCRRACLAMHGPGHHINIQLNSSPVGSWSLLFEDDGPPIDAAKGEAIFEEYVRLSTEGPRAGTGLGMTVVKKCTELLGGVIKVRSAEGEPNRFSFLFSAGPDAQDSGFPATEVY